jgi:SOS response regulatory protein OraA/RecX
MDPITQERREECRNAVLAFLAERQALAHHPQTIRRRLNEGHLNDFTIEEVLNALAFLEGKQRVKTVIEEMGATAYFQSTSEGVLAHERHVRPA